MATGGFGAPCINNCILYIIYYILYIIYYILYIIYYILYIIYYILYIIIIIIISMFVVKQLLFFFISTINIKEFPTPLELGTFL